MQTHWRLLIFSFILCTNIVIHSYAENSSASDPSGKALRVLLFTGGHGFDRESFYEMVFSLDNCIIDTLSQPEANKAFLADSIGIYDVIVFYDMWQDISSAEQNAFMHLTERGTGLVFLHHSLVSYQQWEVFKDIRGGRYNEKNYGYPPEKLSGYKHDIILDVRVEDPSHPVTRGLDDFEIHDEGYSNIEVIPDVTPLLTTNHPDCARIIGWTNKYKNSKVVYILLGHDNNAWSDENFRTIVSNAIEWTGNN